MLTILIIIQLQHTSTKLIQTHALRDEGIYTLPVLEKQWLA